MEILESFRFCPRCSTKFEVKDSHLQCPNCSLTFYINPKPCVAVVLRNDENKYLLVRRAFDPFKDKYDLPGGFVENTETFEQAIRREVKEELNIELGKVKYIGSFNDSYLYQDIMYRTLSVSFFANISSTTKFKPDDDVYAPEFFNETNIPFDNIAFQAMKDTLKAVIDHFSSREALNISKQN